MLRNALIALLALPLANTALGQDTVLRGATRKDVIDGRINGKLYFAATGEASDVVIVRLGDGSVFAAGTMQQLAAGVTRDIGGATLVVFDPNAAAPMSKSATLPNQVKLPTEIAKDAIKRPEVKPAAKRMAAAVEADIKHQGKTRDGVKNGPLTGNTARSLAAGNGDSILNNDNAPIDDASATTDDGIGAPKSFELEFTIFGAPAALGRGSVTVYRANAVLDMDRIFLR